MARGFPLQDTGPGMNQMFHDLAAEEEARRAAERCTHCDSPHPHLHPTVQVEGEVEICTHDFHLTPTNQNTPEYIAGVHAKRAGR